MGVGVGVCVCVCMVCVLCVALALALTPTLCDFVWFEVLCVYVCVCVCIWCAYYMLLSLSLPLSTTLYISRSAVCVYVVCVVQREHPAISRMLSQIFSPSLALSPISQFPSMYVLYTALALSLVATLHDLVWF